MSKDNTYWMFAGQEFLREVDKVFEEMWRMSVEKKPTMFQVQEAILKNICSPSEEEVDDYTVSRYIRASTKREGDSQVGIVLFVGICAEYKYSFADISTIASLEREEYLFKLAKYKRKSRSNDKRFLAKIKLVKNYLRLKYGV